jgi:cardiolipin synthase
MTVTWTSERIFFDGDDYFESVLQDIDGACESVTIEMYIFNDDLLGKQVAARLIAAHQRGVTVRILVDGIGSWTFFDKLYGAFAKRGIRVKIYNPLPFYHPIFGKVSGLKKLSVLGARLWRLNRRNHRKLITIDEEILYVGSFNVAAEHTRYHVEAAWKDMGVRVTGAHVRFAVLNFLRLWRLRDYYRYQRRHRGTLSVDWRGSPLRLNQSFLKRQYFYRDFLERINRSRQRVWLMTPYFIPKRRLIRVLARAAERGVDVRLLISRRTDVRVFAWLQYFYYGYLLRKGVKVYQYTAAVLHAKNYLIDDFMTVGSTNLNHRSFIHDLEVDLVVVGEHNRRTIEAHFLAATESQQAVTLEELKRRPLRERFLSRLFFLFKYWF